MYQGLRSEHGKLQNLNTVAELYEVLFDRVGYYKRLN